MRKLRVSAISFLNTAPLLWDFAQGAPATSGTTLALPPELERSFEVRYELPSQCAESVRAGSADLGLIPVTAYAEIPDLVILPDAAIAAKGALRSILLVSKVRLGQVRTLAADNSSRTSVALARVLFHSWRGVRVGALKPAEAPSIPQFVSHAPDLAAMLSHCDAALLIGDPALLVDRTQYHTWDLAEEWQRLTGKPFVFAVWAARLAALNDMDPHLDLGVVFRRSRDNGLRPANLATIARQWARRARLTEPEVVSYLTNSLSLFLDRENTAGLELFFRYAAECRAIPQAPALRLLGGARYTLSSL